MKPQKRFLLHLMAVVRIMHFLITFLVTRWFSSGPSWAPAWLPDLPPGQRHVDCPLHPLQSQHHVRIRWREEARVSQDEHRQEGDEAVADGEVAVDPCLGRGLLQHRLEGSQGPVPPWLAAAGFSRLGPGEAAQAFTLRERVINMEIKKYG